MHRCAWQVYFDTNKAMADAFGGAGYPFQRSVVSVAEATSLMCGRSILASREQKVTDTRSGLVEASGLRRRVSSGRASPERLHRPVVSDRRKKAATDAALPL